MRRIGIFLNKIRETRERTISILRAPVFDEAAYQIEVEKLHQLRGLMMQRLADATKDLAKQFNQEERRGLAEHLRRPPPFSPGERPKMRKPPLGSRFPLRRPPPFPPKGERPPYDVEPPLD